MSSNDRSCYQTANALGKAALSVVLVALYAATLFAFIQFREPTIWWLLFEFGVLGGLVGGSLMLFIAWLFHLFP